MFGVGSRWPLALPCFVHDEGVDTRTQRNADLEDRAVIVQEREEKKKEVARYVQRIAELEKRSTELQEVVQAMHQPEGASGASQQQADTIKGLRHDKAELEEVLRQVQQLGGDSTAVEQRNIELEELLRRERAQKAAVENRNAELKELVQEQDGGASTALEQRNAELEEMLRELEEMVRDMKQRENATVAVQRRNAELEAALEATQQLQGMPQQGGASTGLELRNSAREERLVELEGKLGSMQQLEVRAMALEQRNGELRTMVETMQDWEAKYNALEGNVQENVDLKVQNQRLQDREASVTTEIQMLRKAQVVGTERMPSQRQQVAPEKVTTDISSDTIPSCPSISLGLSSQIVKAPSTTSPLGVARLPLGGLSQIAKAPSTASPLSAARLPLGGSQTGSIRPGIANQAVGPAVYPQGQPPMLSMQSYTQRAVNSTPSSHTLPIDAGRAIAVGKAPPFSSAPHLATHQSISHTGAHLTPHPRSSNGAANTVTAAGTLSGQRPLCPSRISCSTDESAGVRNTPVTAQKSLPSHSSTNPTTPQVQGDHRGFPSSNLLAANSGSRVSENYRS